MKNIFVDRDSSVHIYGADFSPDKRTQIAAAFVQERQARWSNVGGSRLRLGKHASRRTSRIVPDQTPGQQEEMNEKRGRRGVSVADQ